MTNNELKQIIDAKMITQLREQIDLLREHMWWPLRSQTDLEFFDELRHQMRTKMYRPITGHVQDHMDMMFIKFFQNNKCNGKISR